MRAALGAMGIVGALLVLSGCQKAVAGAAQIERCESHLLSDLRSPSSYKRISASVLDSPVLTAAEYQARVGDEKPPLETKLRLRSVLIEYDAENAFGAAIRELYACDFKISETTRNLEEVKPRETSREADAEMRAKYGENEPYRPDCCLPPRNLQTEVGTP